jgi:hypothetical protein
MAGILRVGTPTVIYADSPLERYSTVFEDDGETGYFYACDQHWNDEGQIFDALHIYNVSSVVDRHLESTVTIIWSDDGLRSALLINDYPHAVFDFAAKRGYCRTNSPRFQQPGPSEWDRRTHEWDDDVMDCFVDSA